MFIKSGLRITLKLDCPNSRFVTQWTFALLTHSGVTIPKLPKDAYWMLLSLIEFAVNGSRYPVADSYTSNRYENTRTISSFPVDATRGSLFPIRNGIALKSNAEFGAISSFGSVHSTIPQSFHRILNVFLSCSGVVQP